MVKNNIHNDSRPGTAHSLSALPHLHRELELILILGGQVKAYADSYRETLKAGDVFLVFPDQIHYYEAKDPVSYYLFTVDPDLVPEFSNLFEAGICADPLIQQAGADPSIRTLFESLDSSDSENADNPYADCLRKGYLLVLLSELLPKMALTSTSSADSGALRAIVSYITEHFSREISLGVLEEQLHLNRYYISHLFSGKLGIGFNDYVNSLRVRRACKLLTDSDASIAEIGTTVGFHTLRTFNRAFVRQTNLSPGEYRKLSKGNL